MKFNFFIAVEDGNYPNHFIFGKPGESKQIKQEINDDGGAAYVIRRRHLKEIKEKIEKKERRKVEKKMAEKEAMFETQEYWAWRMEMHLSNIRVRE